MTEHSNGLLTPLREFASHTPAQLPHSLTCTKARPAGMVGQTNCRKIQQASSIYLEEFVGDELALAQAEFSDDAVVCAWSFEEFLYRFWLENTIWFALDDGKPLTDEQRRYLDDYQSPDRRRQTG